MFIFMCALALEPRIICIFFSLFFFLSWSIEFPWWLNSKESTCQCRRRGFHSWVSEDPLEEEMATQCSILAWKNPMDKRAWQATVHGLSKESDTT